MRKPSTDRESYLEDIRGKQDRIPAMRSNAQADSACIALLAAELGVFFPSLPLRATSTRTNPAKILLHPRAVSVHIFRVLALSRTIEEHTNDISGLQLTPAQLAMMNLIWDHLSVVSQQADRGVLLQPSLDGVHENLFQLLVMFWTDRSHDGNDQTYVTLYTLYQRVRC